MFVFFPHAMVPSNYTATNYTVLLSLCLHFFTAAKHDESVKKYPQPFLTCKLCVRALCVCVDAVGARSVPLVVEQAKSAAFEWPGVPVRVRRSRVFRWCRLISWECCVLGGCAVIVWNSRLGRVRDAECWLCATCNDDAASSDKTKRSTFWVI